MEYKNRIQGELSILKSTLSNSFSQGAQKLTQIGVMRKPNSDFSFDHRVVRIVLNETEVPVLRIGLFQFE